MSSRSKDSRSDRHHSSHRRDSSPRRRRRSASPAGPSQRDERELPPSFGPGERKDNTDDNLNVLQRMQNITGPLELLAEAVANGKELKIWTRNFKEIRGICTGKLLAFDKHWNLVLHEVGEVFLKRRKNKTPFLREIVKGEEIPDLPPRVPRKKASEKGGAVDIKEEAKKPDQPSTSSTAPNGGPEGAKQSGDEKKKKRRKRTKKPAKAADREYGILFVRGDNIVMIAYKED